MAKEKWYVHEGEGKVKKSCYSCHFCGQNNMLFIMKGDWVKEYAFVCDNAECKAQGEFSDGESSAWRIFKDRGERLQPSSNYWESPGPNSLRKRIMDDHGITDHFELYRLFMKWELERLDIQRKVRESASRGRFP